MASSSRSHQTLKIISNEHTFADHEEDQERVSIIGHQQEKEEEEEDWLKLGLELLGSDDHKNIGHGSSNPASQGPSVTRSHHHHPQVGGLGLGLGFGFEGGDSSGLGITKDNNSDKELLGISMVEVDHCNHCHHHNHHNHGNDDGIKLWPSSSSVPSHHYPQQQCGLWFTLRSSTNRSGEALPQIPKAYIRVRDENMTVLMVKKYLVRKLGLSNEAEGGTNLMHDSHFQGL